jgi:AcrR family transcriptional regulator
MVQNSFEAAATQAKRRGRPRSYEPDVALRQAMEAFWKTGYAATSLDDLSAATGMNRPSLYAAFGDKQHIYVKAYRRYRAEMRDAFRPILEADGPVRVVLRKTFEMASEVYLAGPDGPRGCFSVVTAASEAIASLDQGFTALFAKAMARGELRSDADAAALAKIATATIHTLAIRARVRAPKSELRALIDAGITVICGLENRPKRSKREA